jgi:hypothetical protein
MPSDVDGRRGPSLLCNLCARLWHGHTHRNRAPIGGVDLHGTFCGFFYLITNLRDGSMTLSCLLCSLTTSMLSRRALPFPTGATGWKLNSSERFHFRDLSITRVFEPLFTLLILSIPPAAAPTKATTFPTRAKPRTGACSSTISPRCRPHNHYAQHLFSIPSLSTCSTRTGLRTSGLHLPKRAPSPRFCSD